MATQSSFCVFRDISIPSGSVITKAHIYFYSYDTRFGVGIDTDIHFADEDNSQPPTDKTDLDGRSVTASVSWPSIEDWYDNKIYRTPNLKAILQEVMDRSGWTENNNVMAILKVTDGPNSGRFWSALEYLNEVEKACLRVWWRPATQIQTPLILPAEEFQIVPFQITMSTYPTDANIYYTVDGSDPDEGDTLYTVPLGMDEVGTKTIKARAYKQYWLPSEIATRDYNLYSIGQSWEWITENVYSTDQMIAYKDGYHYIAFLSIDPIGPRLVENASDPGSWTVTRLDLGNWDTEAIVMDSNGKVHTFWNDWSNDLIKYITNESGDWVTTTVEASALSRRHNGVAMFDGNGYLHLLYIRGIYDEGLIYSVRHVTNQSGSWVGEDVIFLTGAAHRYLAGVMFSDNTMAFAIAYGTSGNLEVYNGSWGSWSGGAVSPAKEPDKGISGFVDGNDIAHFAFGTGNTDQDGIWILHNEGGQSTWALRQEITQNVLNEGASHAPANNSFLRGFEKDSNGKFYMAFREASTSWARYATNSSNPDYNIMYPGRNWPTSHEERVEFGALHLNEATNEVYIVIRETIAPYFPMMLVTIPHWF
jgi:hypothetical protein